MSFRIKYLLFVILSRMCLICVFKFICLVTSFGISPLISKPNCSIHNPNTPLPKTPKITPHLFPHARHAYLEKTACTSISPCSHLHKVLTSHQFLSHTSPRRTTVIMAAHLHLKTTTLHGHVYLPSPYRICLHKEKIREKAERVPAIKQGMDVL